MKRLNIVMIVFLLIISCFISGCSSSEYTHISDEFKKTKYEFQKYTVDGEYIETLYGHYEYDDKGNIVKDFLYRDEITKAFATYKIYNYDEFNNCIEEAFYNASGEKSTCYKYEYDEDNNCIKKELYGSELIYYYTFEYDEDGKCIRENQFNADGTFVHSWSYEYNQHGNCTRKNADYADYYTTYVYDQNNNCIRETNYSSNNYLESERIWEYDEDGKEISCSVYDEVILTSKTIYFYE